MEKAEPQKEHRWLQKLVGDWTFEGEAPPGPDMPPEKFTGTERVRPIGDLWVVAEGKGDAPGAGDVHTSMMTLGYDPKKGRFVGTWLGSIMAYLWVYEGALDPAERALSLDCEGESMSGDGKMAKYRDVIEFKSDDHRVLTSHVLREDGQWQQFMAMHFHRRK